MSDLSLYRRHNPDCKYVKHGREWLKCKCPIWCDGRIDGKRVNHSMKTKDWDRAERRLQVSFDPASVTSKGKPLSEAVEDYLADCRARHLAETSLVSYRNVLDALVAFATTKELKRVNHITITVLDEFRASRKGRDGKTAIGPKTQRKELEYLRSFCAFCVTREWMPLNPAKALKAPADTAPPTMPFEQSEVDAILEACERIENNNRESAARARLRNRAMILVMLYAGLRVSDVALLERSRLDRHKKALAMRVMKTKITLYVPIPDSVIEALDALPKESPKYFFWSGNGKKLSIIGSLQRSVACVLDLADVKGHPHRFRDTFAVRLLDADTPIRTVQLLLGHKSVRTTELHYAPFVKSTQRLLDAATAKLDFGESPRSPGKKVSKRALGNAKSNVLTLPA